MGRWQVTYYTMRGGRVTAYIQFATDLIVLTRDLQQVASAIAQTYHYMIEGGLEHGLLTTGEAIVFLKIDWEEPETLYYHLAEPGPKVSVQPEHGPDCCRHKLDMDWTRGRVIHRISNRRPSLGASQL